jgi:hypothetical protein
MSRIAKLGSGLDLIPPGRVVGRRYLVAAAADGPGGFANMAERFTIAIPLAGR